MKWLEDRLEIQINSADMMLVLKNLNRQGVYLEEITWIDPLTITGSVLHRDLPAIKQILSSRGDSYTIRRRYGVRNIIRKFWKRPVLSVGVCLLLAIVVTLPTRILFVRVEGNQTVADNLIIESAAKHGIYFGASREKIRSERIKNVLLQELPDLQWIGVNTAGAVAVIQVEERHSNEQPETEGVSYTNIIARKDGIIYSGTVLSGNALFSVGEAVKAGQTLVSGYTDHGLKIVISNAEAEIYAQTKENITLVYPTGYLTKTATSGSMKRYSLQIGKNFINLYKDSGISPIGCDKMYVEKKMVLPGGFTLPISLWVEQITLRKMAVQTAGNTVEHAFLEKLSDSYILQHTVAGEILSRHSTFEAQDGRIEVSSQYICLEMIGQKQNQEFIDYYGENS